MNQKITIKEGQVSTKLYDKRDGFNISIVRLPYRYSNIASKIFYLTISAEILRICRATSSYYDFISSVYRLISQMTKQGAKINNIIKALRQMLFRYIEDFLKFSAKQEDFSFM